MTFQHVHVRKFENEAFEKKYFILFIPHAIEGVRDVMFLTSMSVITPC